MTMTIDEWTKRLNGYFVPDRVRPSPLPEAIGAGDVLDDGSVMTQAGLIVVGGVSVWLTERKARAAAYYGWRQIVGPLGRDGETGEILYPMTR